MKVLLVAATKMEIKLLLNECQFINFIDDNHKAYQYQSTPFDVLITGMGTTFTTYHLTQSLQHANYNLVVNAGLAGSLSSDLSIGEVVRITDDEFADLGIEEENEFLTLFDSGFMKPDEFPFENSLLRADKLPYGSGLTGVKAITTNISHGRRSSISRLRNQFTAQVESMEGAAVFYVCRWFGLPCLQVRAVSNYVAPRDEAQWDIPLALENLKNTLLQLLQEIGRQVN